MIECKSDRSSCNNIFSGLKFFYNLFASKSLILIFQYFSATFFAKYWKTIYLFLILHGVALILCLCSNLPCHSIIIYYVFGFELEWTTSIFFLFSNPNIYVIYDITFSCLLWVQHVFATMQFLKTVEVITDDQLHSRLGIEYTSFINQSILYIDKCTYNHIYKWSFPLFIYLFLLILKKINAYQYITK